MTNVSIKRINHQVKLISIWGHASFNLKGKDIVCASISTLVFHTINAVSYWGFKKKINVRINQNQSKINISVVDLNCDVVQKLMNLLILGLQDIASQFSCSLVVKEKKNEAIF